MVQVRDLENWVNWSAWIFNEIPIYRSDFAKKSGGASRRRVNNTQNIDFFRRRFAPPWINGEIRNTKNVKKQLAQAHRPYLVGPFFEGILEGALQH